MANSGMRSSMTTSLNKGDRQGRSTRFANDDEEDYVMDDEGDANEQLEKMRRLETEMKDSGRPPLSGISMARDGLTTASTRVVDLTSDQISYGIRPSTSIQLQ